LDFRGCFQPSSLPFHGPTPINIFDKFNYLTHDNLYSPFQEVAWNVFDHQNTYGGETIKRHEPAKQKTLHNPDFPDDPASKIVFGIAVHYQFDWHHPLLPILGFISPAFAYYCGQYSTSNYENKYITTEFGKQQTETEPWWCR
jgi:hypothetical protein